MIDAFMIETSQESDLAVAVQELHRYLCDELAPMMVADSIQILMDQPPEMMSSQIDSWIGSQHSLGGTMHSTSDYLYHAVKKLHLLGEFKLVDAGRLGDYLEVLNRHLLQKCPDEERGRLQEQLSRLGQSEAVLSSAPVEKIYQASGDGSSRKSSRSSSPGEPGEAANDVISRGLRRFSLLLERLGNAAGSDSREHPDPQRDQIRVQAILTAAAHASNEKELQQAFRRLGSTGMDSRTAQLFRMLGRSLPAWNIPLVPATAQAPDAPLPSRTMEAMRKMVNLSETPEEWARRFNDLVQTAVEQFNEGSPAQAATMLDLAERMTIGKERYNDVVTAIRRRAHEAIREPRLKKFAERKVDRAVLLRFMNFFPAMTPAGLLRQLHEEKSRERRWILLLLLETHGEPARAAAMEEMETFLNGDLHDPQGFHVRNLVNLLRRVPAPSAGSDPKELDLLANLSKLNQPSILVRETFRTLGAIPHSTAERILVSRLRELEAAALQGSSASAGEPISTLELVDTACLALAQQHTSSSFGEILRHGLREEPELGDAASRLDTLGTRDYSAWPDSVERLLRVLREKLPKKILGLVLKKRQILLHLIRATAGTPLPAVRSFLEEIATKYAKVELGSEAARALEALDTVVQRRELTAPGLSGDIGLFGLPNLFQSLSESEVTGTLSLRNKGGKVLGTVQFQSGKVRGGKTGHLEGTDALYQLFEKPEAGKFAFQASSSGPLSPPEDLIDVVSILMEAVRRHDELQQARALVPDTGELQVTGAKPTRLEDEDDLSLTKHLWTMVVTGTTPEKCEAELPADSFRIRRLLAHWMESGAVRLATR